VVSVWLFSDISEGLLEAWLGLGSLALDMSFYLTKYLPRLSLRVTTYQAFWFLDFDTRIMSMIFSVVNEPLII
jgi:hypothetical protein